MVVRFFFLLVFCVTLRNVVARTRVAFQCATDARITINDFYCRNSHFLGFGKNLSQSLREEKCKIRTK